MLALSGALAVLGIFYADTGTKLPEHFTKGEPQRVPAPLRAAALSSQDREAARVVAEHFIDTAVLRQRIDESWDISTASLHQGLTRAQWGSGNIPVAPFPAEAVSEVKYRVDWSGSDLIYLKIAIVAKPEATVNGLAFDMGLERTGPPSSHRWLVDYWVPSGPGSTQAAGGRRSATRAAAPPPQLKSRIPAAWIFAPVGLMALLILAIPLTLAARGWRRTRRAERLYRESA